VLSAAVPGVLTAQALAAETSGAGDVAQSQASVANLVLQAGANTITASVLASEASARCGPTHPVRQGSSSIVALSIDGVAVAVTGQPNQRVDLLVGYVVINEQTTDRHSITVNALHVVVPGTLDVVVSSSRAGVVCTRA
jgi:hypothetical protein